MTNEIRELGAEYRFLHIARDDGTLWDSGWTHNQMTNEGVDSMFDTYFKNTGSPSGFEMGLYTNATLNHGSKEANVTEHSGDAYARQTVERGTAGWTTEGTEGSPGQQYLLTGTETFGSASAAWTEVNGAFISGSTIGTKTLVAWDPFAVARTLQSGDKLYVTFKLRRKSP